MFEVVRLDDRKKKSLSSRLLDFVFALLMLFFIFILVLTLFFKVCMIDGKSMMNTLHDEDIILYSEAGEFERGDIVIATVNDNSGVKSIIKRIVACPGDEIIFKREQSLSDGNGNNFVYLYIRKKGSDKFVKVDEPFIKDNKMTDLCFTGEYGQDMFKEHKYWLYTGSMDDKTIENIDERYIIRLDEEEQDYFLLGDNRENSRDSRTYGPFNKEDIIGKYVDSLGRGALYWVFYALTKIRIF